MQFTFAPKPSFEPATNGSANIGAKLQELKARADRARTEHARAEAQLETIAKQREEALAELAALGVTEDGLDQAISELEAQIQQALAEAEALLEGGL